MVVKDSPEDTVLEDRCRCDLPKYHGSGIADEEEDASLRFIRQSTRTIRRPPRFTEAEEDPGVDGAEGHTLEDLCQGVVENDPVSLVEVPQVLDAPNTETNQQDRLCHLGRFERKRLGYFSNSCLP